MEWTDNLFLIVYLLNVFKIDSLQKLYLYFDVGWLWSSMVKRGADSTVYFKIAFIFIIYSTFYNIEQHSQGKKRKDMKDQT